MQRLLKRKRRSESGFQIEIGPDGRDGDIDGQVKQAIRFVRRYATEISRLSKFGVDQKHFSFGVLWEGNIVSKTHSFPAELLKLAGAAGIDLELSDYLSSRESQG